MLGAAAAELTLAFTHMSPAPLLEGVAKLQSDGPHAGHGCDAGQVQQPRL